jgi:hypothetical protein
MTTRKLTKLIHEGDFLAEVDVELQVTDDSWSPTLSVDDAMKLDAVREALRGGDVGKASQMARVYSLQPVAV